MLKVKINRQNLVALATLSLLAGCSVVPKSGPSSTGPSQGEPSENTLPSDNARHRIALLVPMTGNNAAVGQSIANAATMALLDANASNLRITTYDTNTGAASAAASAIADGSKLILGPLLTADIAPITAAARQARIPIISYSNDISAASRDIFIMGNSPDQSINRSIKYVRAQGASRFAALVPNGEYGERASAAFMTAVRNEQGTVSAIEHFARSNPAITTAAHRLKNKAGYDAVFLAESPRLSRIAAPILRSTTPAPTIIGTELWSGDSSIASTPALRGAFFSAVTDSRFRQFADSYNARFGQQPHRIATLGYDSVLLTLRISQNWRVGTAFPAQRLTDKDGFLGIDGIFRFKNDGLIERALEVREVRANGVTVVSPAPTSFSK